MPVSSTLDSLRYTKHPVTYGRAGLAERGARRGRAPEVDLRRAARGSGGDLRPWSFMSSLKNLIFIKNLKNKEFSLNNVFHERLLERPRSDGDAQAWQKEEHGAVVLLKSTFAALLAGAAVIYTPGGGKGSPSQTALRPTSRKTGGGICVVINWGVLGRKYSYLRREDCAPKISAPCFGKRPEVSSTL